MILSLVLRNYADLAIVGALLVVNAVLGFWQKRRAAGVMETLRRRLQVSARVLRDAKWQVVPSRELVPGDIVRVRPGDIVPADVKVLTGTLSVDQSINAWRCELPATKTFRPTRERQVTATRKTALSRKALVSKKGGIWTALPKGSVGQVPFSRML